MHRASSQGLPAKPPTTARGHSEGFREPGSPLASLQGQSDQQPDHQACVLHAHARRDDVAARLARRTRTPSIGGATSPTVRGWRPSSVARMCGSSPVSGRGTPIGPSSRRRWHVCFRKQCRRRRARTKIFCRQWLRRRFSPPRRRTIRSMAMRSTRSTFCETSAFSNDGFATWESSCPAAEPGSQHSGPQPERGGNASAPVRPFARHGPSRMMGLRLGRALAPLQSEDPSTRPGATASKRR